MTRSRPSTRFAEKSVGSRFAALFTHPFAGSQLSAVQARPSTQSSAGPGTHTPAEQVSFAVHALPSSHAIVLFVNTQPVAALHESVVQTLLSLQASVPAPGWQLPPPQVSPAVHASPSLQAAVLLVWVQPSASVHESVVQMLPSSQLGPEPPTQAPKPSQ